ncbi:Ig-like domain-containing protein [Corynebacterium silvaticum]|nr:Ig-like domain-containing protein [Corynebacterium silvaticum]UWH00802.1 hypothetical protein K1I39_03260 [Corynebacterium silvaticum]UXZ29077.1 hypothetical protein K3930_03260 [Corynebacterium silvaticum]
MCKEASRSWRALLKRLIKAAHISQGICVAAIVALVFSVVSVVAETPTAHAQNDECAGTWENLKWVDGNGVKNGSYDNASTFATAEFTWSIPDSAQPGETISFTLPKELKPASGTQHSFKLYDPQNQEVAVATWSGKTLNIVLSEYVSRHYEVSGEAKISLEWDRSSINIQNGYDSSRDGKLQFRGCGTGDLDGKYPADGPAGSTHESSKVGSYIGKTIVDGTFVYITHWAAYIGSDTKGTETTDGGFRIEDTAPAGHKFACDSKYNGGYDVVDLFSYYRGQRYPGAIYDAYGRYGQGQYNGVNQPTSGLRGYNFEVFCTPEKLIVTFPYGISPQSGPAVSFYTYTEVPPIPFSRQQNTVYINGKPYVGEVQIPGAEGSGSGKFGGFAIRKLVKASESVQTPPSFTFSYRCTSGTITKSGTTDVPANGDFVHVKDIEKGMRCEVTEVSPRRCSTEATLDMGNRW